MDIEHLSRFVSEDLTTNRRRSGWNFSTGYTFEDENRISPVGNLVRPPDYVALDFRIWFNADPPEPRTLHYPGSPGGVSEFDAELVGITDGNNNKLPLTPEIKGAVDRWYEQLLQSDKAEFDRVMEACRYELEQRSERY